MRVASLCGAFFFGKFELYELAARFDLATLVLFLLMLPQPVGDSTSSIETRDMLRKKIESKLENRQNGVYPPLSKHHGCLRARGWNCHFFLARKFSRREKIVGLV